MKTVLLLVMLAASPAAAQSTALDRLTPALPEGGRLTADIASYVLPAVLVTLDTLASWKAPDRARAFELQGARIGITYGAAFLVKGLVHRSRPCAPACGIDDPTSSFWSAHTAIAFSTVGGPRLAIALPLAIGTGGLRIEAGKHWLTDTLAGAGAGWLASRLR